MFRARGEWAVACAAFITAWQRGAGIEQNTIVVETAPRSSARIPASDRGCALIDRIMPDFVHEIVLPAGLKLLQ